MDNTLIVHVGTCGSFQPGAIFSIRKQIVKQIKIIDNIVVVFD